MDGLHIEWDPHKAAVNRRKHGVGFEEAESVFLDERAVLIADPDHSDDEDRFILLGMSQALRMLIVCHAYREPEDVIRIISARKALAREQKQYWER